MSDKYVDWDNVLEKIKNRKPSKLRNIYYNTINGTYWFETKVYFYRLFYSLLWKDRLHPSAARGLCDYIAEKLGEGLDLMLNNLNSRPWGLTTKQWKWKLTKVRNACRRVSEDYYNTVDYSNDKELKKIIRLEAKDQEIIKEFLGAYFFDLWD